VVVVAPLLASHLHGKDTGRHMHPEGTCTAAAAVWHSAALLLLLLLLLASHVACHSHQGLLRYVCAQLSGS
jgi:hypothetical protein